MPTVWIWFDIQESIRNCKGIEATAKDTKSLKMTDPMIKEIGSGSHNAAGRTFTTVDIQNTPKQLANLETPSVWSVGNLDTLWPPARLQRGNNPYTLTITNY